MFDYLRECASLDSLPHQFEITLSTITPPDPSFSFAGKSHLQLVIHDIVHRHLGRLNTTAETHFIDEIIGILNSIWQQRTIENPIMPLGTIQYLNSRTSDSAISSFLDRGDPSHLISAIIVTLGRAPPLAIDASVSDSMTALWRIFTLSPLLPQTVYEATLVAIETKCGPCPCPSIIALLKTNILKTFSLQHCALGLRMTIGDIKSRLANPILLADTAFNIPVELLGDSPEGEITTGNLDALNQILRDRITEARIGVLTELFERCSSSVLPNHVVDTLPFIANFPPPASIHANHQTQFANSIHAMSAHMRSHLELLKAVVNAKIFDLYAAGRDPESKWCISGLVQKHPWLDNPSARRTIQDSLSHHATSLSLNESSAPLISRIQSIIEGMNTLHQATFIP
ncbi:hypothetical protein DFH09DRAFT_1168343 [Mycena vulgaris]|nr:hypothetical protein DFH09DRAFT_1168343 [Mycena vulgaris]